MSEDKRSMPRLPRYDYEDRMAWDRIMEDNKRALLQAERANDHLYTNPKWSARATLEIEKRYGLGHAWPEEKGDI